MVSNAKTAEPNGKAWANPVACTLFERILTGAQPLIPAEYRGLEVPAVDFFLVFDWFVKKYCGLLEPARRGEFVKGMARVRKIFGRLVDERGLIGL